MGNTCSSAQNVKESKKETNVSKEEIPKPVQQTILSPKPQSTMMDNRIKKIDNDIEDASHCLLPPHPIIPPVSFPPIEASRTEVFLPTKPILDGQKSMVVVDDSDEPGGSEDNILATLKMEDVKDHSMVGWKGRVRLDRVIDGDTIVVIFRSFKGIDIFERSSCRLVRIDAPEMHPKGNLPNKGKEIEMAIASRDFLHNLIHYSNSNGLMTMNVTSRDKYGRLLAEFLLASGNISDTMLRSHHAVPYDGKKKKGQWGVDK